MAKTTPLAINCTAAECDADLHCFRPRSGMDPAQRGRCRECGADLIDWPLIHRRDANRLEPVLQALPRELVRHHYWHVAIPDEVRRRATSFRREVIAHRTELAIHSHVGPPSDQLGRDGMQTADLRSPNRQIYFMGMHATACCCRKCLEYWHGIPCDQQLTPDDERYLAKLVWAYVCERMQWTDSIDLL